MRGVAIYKAMKTFWKRSKNQPVISRIIDHDLKDIVKVITKKPHPKISYPLKEKIME